MSDPIQAKKSQVEKLRAKIDFFNAQNSLLKAQDSNRRLEMLNGMGNLVGAAQFRQENITSIAPLITNSQYQVLTLQYNVLQFMYQTHGLVQTGVGQPILDAHKDKINLISRELTYRNLGELEDWYEENQAHEPFCDTQEWGRLFGGSALVVNVAGDPSKPMNLKDIERGRFALYPAARWELGSTWRYSDTYNFYGVNFDKSRVFTFIGKRMPWLLERQLSGWGASVVARAAEDFNMFLRTRNVLYEILNEAKLDVYKMDGYNQQLLTATGTSEVDQKIQMTNSLKSFHGALVLDKLDDYQQKQLSFTGLAEVMAENRIGIASAWRMPISKLFGTGSKGFSSGEDDLENYNGMVTAEIRRPARPLLLEVLKLGVLALYGRPYHIDFEYPPLRSLNAKELEETKTSIQNRIIQQLDAGLIDESEAAAWAKHEKLVPIQTKLAERGMSKTGAPVKDAQSRKKDQNTKPQGADHARRTGSGVSGDGRQVPKFG